MNDEHSLNMLHSCVLLTVTEWGNHDKPHFMQDATPQHFAFPTYVRLANHSPGQWM
jgi:hypothetical protein